MKLCDDHQRDYKDDFSLQDFDGRLLGEQRAGMGTNANVDAGR
jgi:hypothetical protein